HPPSPRLLDESRTAAVRARISIAHFHSGEILDGTALVAHRNRIRRHAVQQLSGGPRFPRAVATRGIDIAKNVSGMEIDTGWEGAVSVRCAKRLILDTDANDG